MSLTCILKILGWGGEEGETGTTVLEHQLKKLKK